MILILLEAINKTIWHTFNQGIILASCQPTRAVSTNDTNANRQMTIGTLILRDYYLMIVG